MFPLIINWGEIITLMKSSVVIHPVLIYELLQTDTMKSEKNSVLQQQGISFGGRRTLHKLGQILYRYSMIYWQLVNWL
jgi:hypothetical protein